MQQYRYHYLESFAASYLALWFVVSMMIALDETLPG
jgi:hypothetical protein